MAFYVIILELDEDVIRKHHRNFFWEEYEISIERILNQFGFVKKQKWVYFGSERVDAIMCTLASQHLRDDIEWFASSVKEMRMLRVDEEGDLRYSCGLIPYN